MTGRCKTFRSARIFECLRGFSGRTEKLRETDFLVFGLGTYVEMLAESREEALNEMVEEAEKLGADAVINVRFMTSAVMGGAAEMLAYGTAVKLE